MVWPRGNALTVDKDTISRPRPWKVSKMGSMGVSTPGSRLARRPWDEKSPCRRMLDMALDVCAAQRFHPRRICRAETEPLAQQSTPKLVVQGSAKPRLPQ